jgi:hypothetical protein
MNFEDVIEFDGSGSCPMAGVRFSGAEISCYTARDVISQLNIH